MQTTTRSDLEPYRPYLSCIAIALAAIASRAAAQDAEQLPAQEQPAPASMPAEPAVVAPPPQPCVPCAEEKGAPSEGAGMFLIGAAWLDLSSLNDRLAANGYDKVTGAMVMLGGEGHAVFESGFVAGGRGAAILGPKGDGPDDLQTDFSGGYGLVDLGFAFVHTPAMLLTLTGGIGGYGMSLRIGEDQNVRFDDVLKNPRRGTTLSYGGLLAGATVGFDGRVPIGKVDEHGRRGFFTLGARVGGLFGPALGEWGLPDGSDAKRGPHVGLTGVYAALAIGFGGGPAGAGQL